MSVNIFFHLHVKYSSRYCVGHKNWRQTLKKSINGQNKDESLVEKAPDPLMKVKYLQLNFMNPYKTISTFARLTC